MSKNKNYVELLIKSEPYFVKAGKLALKQQPAVIALAAKHDGELRTSIVTETDIKVQELILSQLTKDGMTKCKLYAEEKSPSTSRFNRDGNLVLAIDPIDGTERYVKQQKLFSFIISLHNKNEYLYTYVYYPALKLSIRITKQKLSIKGKVPKLKTKQAGPKTIMVVRGEPKKEAGELYNKYKKMGYHFINREDLINKSGTTTILLAFHKIISGYYASNPNAYDGLLDFHFAQASGYKIHQGPEGKISLDNPFVDSGTPRYKGYFLAIIK